MAIKTLKKEDIEILVYDTCLSDYMDRQPFLSASPNTSDRDSLVLGVQFDCNTTRMEIVENLKDEFNQLFSDFVVDENFEPKYEEYTFRSIDFAELFTDQSQLDKVFNSNPDIGDFSDEEIDEYPQFYAIVYIENDID